MLTSPRPPPLLLHCLRPPPPTPRCCLAGEADVAQRSGDALLPPVAALFGAGKRDAQRAPALGDRGAPRGHLVRPSLAGSPPPRARRQGGARGAGVRGLELAIHHRAQRRGRVPRRSRGQELREVFGRHGCVNILRGVSSETSASTPVARRSVGLRCVRTCGRGSLCVVRPCLRGVRTYACTAVRGVRSCLTSRARASRERECILQTTILRGETGETLCTGHSRAQETDRVARTNINYPTHTTA